mgnify:CR=1 FL=1
MKNFSKPMEDCLHLKQIMLMVKVHSGIQDIDKRPQNYLQAEYFFQKFLNRRKEKTPGKRLGFLNPPFCQGFEGLLVGKKKT